jgi:hypothetical protein
MKLVAGDEPQPREQQELRRDHACRADQEPVASELGYGQPGTPCGDRDSKRPGLAP